MNRDTFRFSDYFVSADGLERSRVKYGMSWLKGNQLPYFSITLEREERRSVESTSWKYSGGGAALKEIAEKFPALAPLVKWHMCDQNGTLMHYIANAVFWYEIARGERKAGPYDKNPLGSFKSCAAWGAVASDGELNTSALMSTVSMRTRLQERLPLLQATFKREMEAAGVTFILPVETVS